MTIHDVDLLSYLSNSDVTSLFASGGSKINNNREDHIILSLKFSNGVIGLCETNWLSSERTREINIITDKFNVSLDLINQSLKISSKMFSESVNFRIRYFIFSSPQKSF